MFVGYKSGSVYGTWTSRQPNDADHPGIVELPDDHPDVVTFLNRPAPPPDPIDELRSAMKADPTLLDKLKAVK